MPCVAILGSKFAELSTCWSETSCKSGVDRLLGVDGSATSSWDTGSMVNQQDSLSPVCDIPPNELIVKAGTHYSETGKRLPVRDDNGQSIAEDTIPLGSVRVTERGNFGGIHPRHQSSGGLRVP